MGNWFGQTFLEVEDELADVEIALRNCDRTDGRQTRWKGYRDALKWILGKGEAITKEDK